MRLLVQKLAPSPGLARALPFIVFIVLTYAQGECGEAARYWLYVTKTVVAAWLLWTLRSLIPEMRWKLSGPAVVVGVAVFIMWVGLDDWIRALGIERSFHRLSKPGNDWNPFTQFGAGSTLAWFVVIARLVGVTLVVPPLEEVFYRSFLYRYMSKTDFLSLPVGQFVWMPFLVTAFIFGFSHLEWLAAVLCGFAYQGLVCWTQRIGDAIAAHAITNGLLGLWVIERGAWQFW